MTRKILFVLLLVVSALTASAQECRLTGSVIDKDTKEKMEQTTVQLLRKDSSYVAGTVTDDRGEFALKVDRKGPQGRVHPQDLQRGLRQHVS